MSKYIGYTIEGNAEEQELLLAMLSDFSIDSFQEGEESLEAFIPYEFWEKERDAIQSFLNERSLKYKSEEYPDINWNQEWEKHFEPIHIDNKVYVRAEFHPARPEIPVELIITPQMSFGTGHHATTYLMLLEMSALDFKAKRVLDMGCGTGILGIYAAKLGAAEVLGADIEQWAVENSKENIAKNEVNVMQVIQADIDMIPQSKHCDIVLANINRNVLLEHLPHYNNLLEKHGDLLLSGILNEDEELLMRAINKLGLSLVNKSQKGNWSLLHYKKG